MEHPNLDFDGGVAIHPPLIEGHPPRKNGADTVMESFTPIIESICNAP